MGDATHNSEKWHRVSFRLFGEFLPIDEVEERLHLSKGYSARKGDHIRNNPRYAKHQTTFWLWRYEADSSVPFDQQLNEVLAILEARCKALQELLALPGVEGELFLGFGSENGQGGAYFSCNLLKRISALGLSILLDLYPPGDPDEQDE